MNEPMRYESWQASDGIRAVYLEVTHLTQLVYDDGHSIGEGSSMEIKFNFLHWRHHYCFSDTYEENTFGDLNRMALASRLSADGWELVTATIGIAPKLTEQTEGYFMRLKGEQRTEKVVMIFKRRL